MAEKYSAQFAKRGGYVFDRATISNLHKIASAFIGDEVTITLKLAGDHTIEGNDINSILNDFYVISRRIVRLDIDGRTNNTEPPRRISISLRSKEAFTPVIDVTITGDRTGSTATRTEIENIIEGRADWYSRFFLPIHPVPIISWIIVVAMICGSITWTFHALFEGAPVIGDKVQTSYIAETVMLLSAVFVLKSKMFPKIGFDIGKSSSYVNAAKIWRTVVFSGIIIGISVSVVAGLLVEKFK